MAYYKLEPGTARGLAHRRSGVDSTFGIGSRAIGHAGEANNAYKQHFAVEPVKWDIHKRTKITVGKDGIRRVPALRK